jgi:hypothetical protein
VLGVGSAVSVGGAAVGGVRARAVPRVAAAARAAAAAAAARRWRRDGRGWGGSDALRRSSGGKRGKKGGGGDMRGMAGRTMMRVRMREFAG